MKTLRMRLFLTLAAMPFVAVVGMTLAQAPPATELPPTEAPVAGPNAARQPLVAPSPAPTAPVPQFGPFSLPAGQLLSAPVDVAPVGSPPPAEQAELRVFKLRHLTGYEAMYVVSRLFGNAVPVSAMPTNRTIIARGSADDLRAIENLLSALDVEPPETWPGKEELENGLQANVSVEQQAGQVALWLQNQQRWSPPTPGQEIRIFLLHHAAPRAVVGTLLTLYGSPAGDEVVPAPGPTFVFVPSQPAIIVRGKPDDLREIEAIVERIDEGAAETPSIGQSKLADADTSPLAPGVSDPALTVTPGPDGRPVYGIRVERGPIDPAYIDQLRAEYAERDATVRERVAHFRQSGDGVKAGYIRQSLGSHVANAFDARQNLQRAELAELEDRLVSMRRTLEAREQIKGQIIERRVEELLNPALEWDTSGTTGPSAIGPNGPVSGATPVDAAPIGLSGPPNLPQGSELHGATPAVVDSASSERLYQGRTESEWKRLFAAETDAAAKLNAAIALLNLSGPLSPEQRAERILDIGEELVSGVWGERALEFALVNLPPNGWMTNQETTSAYGRFSSELTRFVGVIPAAVLAEEVASALSGSSAHRAAIAFSILHTFSQVYGDREASRLLFERLSHISKTSDRPASAFALLAQINVASAAADEELRQLGQEIVAFRQELRKPQEHPLPYRFREWLVGSRLPPALKNDADVARAFAELILDDAISRNELSIVPVNVQINGTRPPYDQAYVNGLRDQSGAGLNAWAAVANDYLEQHKSAPYTAGDRNVAFRSSRVVPLYSDGDEWPVARTAELLTEQLRAAYTDDPAATINLSVDELLPASPLAMLSQIVAISGEIPEFVKTGSPKSGPVAARIATLKRLLAGEVSPQRAEEEMNRVAGLLAEAPDAVVRLAVMRSVREIGDSSQPKVGIGTRTSTLAGFLSIDSPLNIRDSAYVSSGIDPLLLLCSLSDLTGESAEQDARIASLESMEIQNASFAEHIRNLLASRLQSRKHAARMLREIAAKTESPELLEMIRAIDPGAVAVDTSATESESTGEPGT